MKGPLPVYQMVYSVALLETMKFNALGERVMADALDAVTRLVLVSTQLFLGGKSIARMVREWAVFAVANSNQGF